jgi:ABC-type branched-subunit amino acid transport system substrate-binding protein
VFALAASFIAGAETEVARRLDEEGVPIIGPQTLFPQTGFPLNRRVFYLTAGLQGQSRALIRYARDHYPVEARKAVFLFPQAKERSDEGLADDGLEQVAKSIDADFAESGWPLQLCATPLRGFDPKMLAQRLAKKKTSIVFSLLTAEQNLELLQAAIAHHWYPICFVAGNLVGPEIFDAPAQFDGRVFLSFGSLPSKQPVGIRAYNTLAEEFKLPTGQLATQFEALAAMKTLVQALQQSGSSVSRERMIEQLETFHESRTGFAPPLTFGPNRRVGANGAYVVTTDLINKKLVPVSDWVEGSATSQSDL